MGLHLRVCLTAIVLAAALEIGSYFALPALHLYIATLILAPGMGIALLLKTPDIHGGAGYLRVVLIADFFVYFVVAVVAQELWLWRRTPT
jgi:hypothetical protein